MERKDGRGKKEGKQRRKGRRRIVLEVQVLSVTFFFQSIYTERERDYTSTIHCTTTRVVRDPCSHVRGLVQMRTKENKGHNKNDLRV